MKADMLIEYLKYFLLGCKSFNMFPVSWTPVVLSISIDQSIFDLFCKSEVLMLVEYYNK